MVTLKNTTISMLLVLAIGLSAWSMLASHSPISLMTNNPKEIDSFMQDIVATVFDKEGKPTFKLLSPQMVHYPENNTTDVTMPRISVFRKTPSPWYIQADRAKATHGTTQVVFQSHVNIHHPGDKATPPTLLRTESLTILSEQKIATTHEPVTFIQPDSTVHAVGMLADLEAGTIKLLSQAQGEYAPAS